MSSKPFQRKDIKHDEFILGAGRLGHWLMERRRRIGWAVVKRPVRVAPRWTTFLEIMHALVPGLLQWVFTHGHEGFHRMMGRRLKRMDARKRDPRS